MRGSTLFLTFFCIRDSVRTRANSVLLTLHVISHILYRISPLKYLVIFANFNRFPLFHTRLPITNYRYTSGSFNMISVIPCSSNGLKSSLFPVGFSGYRCPDIHARTVIPLNSSFGTSIPLQNGCTATALHPPLILYRQSDTCTSRIPSSAS